MKILLLNLFLISFIQSQGFNQIVKTYNNGQKKTERFYKDGKVEGLEYYWYEGGQKFRELAYSDNELISEKKWHEDGSLIE